MKTFKRFAPITKVDADKREVWGTLAEEALDKSNEIFDYEKSKPYFQKWNQQFHKLTASLEEPSVGNVREMHGKSAAGKFTVMNYDDASKLISVCAKVVDDNAWKKVESGVYTGFSIGGDYVETWADPVVKGAKRYIADPKEGSLVDNPCMYGATFEVVKADGATELRKFVGTDAATKLSGEFASLRKFVETALAKPALTKKVDGHDLAAPAFLIVKDAANPDTWQLPIAFPTPEATKAAIAAALTKFNSTEGHTLEAACKLIASAKKQGVDVSNFAEEYIKAAFPNALAKRASEQKLQKNMWDIGRLADTLVTLAWMEQGLTDEAIYEDDDSPIPAKLRELLLPLRQILLELVAEESAELLRISEAEKSASTELQKSAPPNPGNKEATPMANEALTKRLEAGTPLTPEELKKVATALAKAKSSLAKLEKSHEGMQKAHDAMGDHIEKMKDCMGKAADSGDLAKAHGSLASNHATLGEHLDDACGYIEDMKSEADEVDDDATKGPAKAALSRLEKRLSKSHAREIGELKSTVNDLTSLLTKFVEVQTGGAPTQPAIARTAVAVEKSADGGQGVGAIVTPAVAKTAASGSETVTDAYGMPDQAYVNSKEATGAGFQKAAAANVKPQVGNPFPSNK